MNRERDLSIVGGGLLAIRFLGIIALLVIPIYLIYRILKWVFDN